MAGKKSKAKPNRQTSSGSLGNVGRVFRGPTGPLALLLLILAVFFGAWFFVWYGMGFWEGVRGYVLSSPEYRVTAGDVLITPPPDWVRNDIRSEVFRDAVLDGQLSIMDEGLAERLAGAFSLHPWVAKVQKVTKQCPAQVRVDLVYRRPVCMVETLSGTLLPVDPQGILLPKRDFSPVETSRYPRLTGIDTVPVGSEGTSWGDSRVVGGAEIAAVLGREWHELNLERIVPSQVSPVGRPDETIYDLYTREGTRIVWGRAPGTDMPGEVPAPDKVARLKKYFLENGTLEGPSGPQQFDVRSLRSMYVPPSTAGNPQQTRR